MHIDNPYQGKKKKKKKKNGLFVMFAVGILGIYQNTFKHFCNKHAIQNTVIYMYGTPVYDKT